MKSITFEEIPNNSEPTSFRVLSPGMTWAQLNRPPYRFTAPSDIGDRIHTHQVKIAFDEILYDAL